MESDTLSRIESILKETDALSPEKRLELLSLVSQLREETSILGATHAATVREITDQAHALARQALDPARDRESVGRALTRFSHTVNGFEESHPRLVQVTNAICTALANMGI